MCRFPAVPCSLSSHIPSADLICLRLSGRELSQSLTLTEGRGSMELTLYDLLVSWELSSVTEPWGGGSRSTSKSEGVFIRFPIKLVHRNVTWPSL